MRPFGDVSGAIVPGMPAGETAPIQSRRRELAEYDSSAQFSRMVPADDPRRKLVLRAAMGLVAIVLCWGWYMNHQTGKALALLEQAQARSDVLAKAVSDGNERIAALEALVRESPDAPSVSMVAKGTDELVADLKANPLLLWIIGGAVVCVFGIAAAWKFISSPAGSAALPIAAIVLVLALVYGGVGQ